MKKQTIAGMLASAIVSFAFAASAAQCESDEVNVETTAICGPFGDRYAPLSEGFSLSPGEGVSFVTGLGGNPVFLRAQARAPAISAAATGYDDNGDVVCSAEAGPNEQDLDDCDPDEIVTHDAVVVF
jgi:hypothetical protein